MSDQFRGRSGIRIVFYNTENLFHPGIDSLNPDSEFTPQGARHWYWQKYQSKLHRIAKVILSCGGWEPPAIVGLCEIENRQVLYDLVFRSPLKKFGYKIIHYESKDPRGIDVALLFRPEKVDLINSIPIAVTPYSDTGYHSRDILHAELALFGIDTIDLFVNHWPSRRSGQHASSSARVAAAKTLCRYSQGTTLNDKVLMMGDFNDEASDHSIAALKGCFKNELESVMPVFENPKVRGTIVHDPGTGLQWYTFDMFLASRACYESKSGFQISGNEYHVFSPDWIIEKREIGDEWAPKRCFNGYLYQEGFSDHLPIVIDLIRP